MEQIEVKATVTIPGEGTIAGYASLFGVPADLVNDIVSPGAFKSSLSAKLPKMLSEHGGEPIGQWTEVVEDELGLRVKGRFDLNSKGGRDAYQAVKSGRSKGLSIGFVATRAPRGPDGVRTLEEIDLREISVVREPASSRAIILNTKSAPAGKETDMAEIAELETKMKTLSESVADGLHHLTEHKSETSKLTDRLDKLEAKANRPAADPKADNGEIEKKALASWVRGGVQSLDEDEIKSLRDIEMKTLRLGSNPAGGYVVAPEFSTRILQSISELSPMRTIANIMSISTTEVIIPKLATHIQPGWVTEIGPRPTSEPTFDQQKISVHEQAVIVPISQQLLEDSFVDLESFLRNHIAREFAKMEAASFVVGDGNGKPEGFLNDPDIYEAVETAADGTGIVDSLIALYYALPTEYARNAVWTMNRKTMAMIRGQMDNTQRMIWGDSLATGQPNTLLGRPIYEMVDMPDLAAGNVAAAFGDFNVGYQIVDRIGIQTMRDDYTGADNGIVKIRARRRVGGAPVMEEAIAVLKGTGE